MQRVIVIGICNIAGNYYSANPKEWPWCLSLLWKASRPRFPLLTESPFKRRTSVRSQLQAANSAAWVFSGLPYYSTQQRLRSLGIFASPVFYSPSFNSRWCGAVCEIGSPNLFNQSPVLSQPLCLMTVRSCISNYRFVHQQWLSLFFQDNQARSLIRSNFP
jgi:hypothetical protein